MKQKRVSKARVEAGKKAWQTLQQKYGRDYFVQAGKRGWEKRQQRKHVSVWDTIKHYLLGEIS